MPSANLINDQLQHSVRRAELLSEDTGVPLVPDQPMHQILIVSKSRRECFGALFLSINHQFSVLLK
jgi:hypothetical protein